ncbi:MAG: GNAT family N-acetyltransferase [Clostridia bacterium]|nr:GNAT family N-acetyltransferase [Clostridia bacterium]
MIQPVNQNHIKECVNVIKESFLTVANEFGFTEKNAPRFTAFATTEQRLSWQLNNENRPMYAFVVDGNIVGYYSLALQENQECELNNLCVVPRFRHQGIGEKLLFHSFDMAKSMGCSKMKIGIVEENQILRKWYESFGFRHIETKKFDFFPFTCGYMELLLT